MIAHYIIISSIYYIFPGIRLLYKSAISSSVFGGRGQIPGKKGVVIFLGKWAWPPRSNPDYGKCARTPIYYTTVWCRKTKQISTLILKRRPCRMQTL